MPKKTKLGVNRLDKYYYLSKQKGYRSRAAFKLIQLNKKYQFLNRAQCVVDICAAPGGWLQICREICPMNTSVYGVDLAEIKPIPHAETFVGDITLPKTLKHMKTMMQNKKADVVLHDGAPNVGGKWTQDAYSQIELVLHSIRMACDLMQPNAWFITKVFRSKDYMTLVWVLKQLFEKVEATKPKASRSTSAEIYLVCSGFKAPKEIDPKLLNPEFVFQDKSNQELTTLKYELAWRKGKRKRNRDGYEDDDFVLFKRNSARAFIECDKPIVFLVKYGIIEFDDESKIFENHPETTKEIKTLLSDTKVMGKKDFKVVLKWRNSMLEYKNELEKNDKMDDIQDIGDAESSDEEDYNMNENKEQSLEDLQREILEMKIRAKRKKEKLEKKRIARESKRPETALDLMERSDDVMDNIIEGHLFALSSLESREALERAVSREASKMMDEEAEEEEIQRKEEYERKKERELYGEDVEYDDEDMEEQLDQLYNQYKNEVSKERKLFLEQLKHLDSERRNKLFKEIKEEAAEVLGAGNPLLVELPDDESKPSIARQTEAWYSQNIFNILQDDNTEELATKQTKRRRLDEEGNSASNPQPLKFGSGNQPFQFQSIAVDDDGADDSSEESDAEDNEEVGEDGLPDELNELHTRATTLAIAKKMLRKKARRDFIEGAYNRYAFNDTDNLPDWFQDEFRDIYRPNIPVTKEEIQEEKRRIAELNSKPIKAKLEAEFRRKRKLAKNRKDIVAKATSIAESRDMTSTQKSRELNKLYKAAKGKETVKKVYVTPNQGYVKKGKNEFVKRVDRRMKADNRK